MGSKPGNQLMNLYVPFRTRIALIAIFAIIGLSLVTHCFAQDQTANSADPVQNSDPYGLNEKPEVAKGIGVDSQTGEFLVMDIPFHDDQNRYVKIGDYFDGKRPVLLSFNYSNCPKLCSVQLENMTDTLREIKFKVDEDFQVVSVSIDPNEQTSRARKTKEKYVQRYSKYDRKGSENGWHFLTGKNKNIQLIADICGFRYKYVPEQKLYSHPPVFIMISPKGKIVRYIHGLDYDPDTIEKALIETAEGRIGSPINILSYGLGCFSFNESTGKYTLQAMAIMRIGGALTAILLLFTLVPYWFHRRGSKSDDKKNSGLPVPGTPASST
jgi:protein SCO1/2